MLVVVMMMMMMMVMMNVDSGGADHGDGDDGGDGDGDDDDDDDGDDDDGYMSGGGERPCRIAATVGSGGEPTTLVCSTSMDLAVHCGECCCTPPRAAAPASETGATCPRQYGPDEVGTRRIM